MGKLSKQDPRYGLLAKIPRNRDGVVRFRKRCGHQHRFLMAVMDLDAEGLATVLYKMKQDAGETLVAFDHSLR
jgi:hypothetical protein